MGAEILRSDTPLFKKAADNFQSTSSVHSSMSNPGFEYPELRAKPMEPRELTLTCKGMSFVNWDCSDADFEFVVGDDKVCRVHSVLAEFLSPKVARIRKCDPLCYVYTFKDSELFDVFDSLVLSLRSGESFRVEKSNFVELLRLSQELENDNLLSSLLGLIKVESLSFEEAILLLRSGVDLGTAFSTPFGTLTDFIAFHFYGIEKKLLNDLDLETTEIVLRSPKLRIEDEDSLYDFVRSRSENDLRFASLFEFVHFEYLSVDRIKHFASFVNENLLANINVGLWNRISRRLICETKPSEQNPHKCRNRAGKKVKSGREFTYHDSRLEGIIAYLTYEYDGNVHEKGVVRVSASSAWDDGEGWYSRPEFAADLGKGLGFRSADEEGNWICYDFKDRRVIPTSYSVRSMGDNYGEHLKSWVIEVSNDGSLWTEIDRRDNNYSLTNSYATVNFKIPKVPSEMFRFFRLRQTGKNHRGSYEINITALEIFGTLFEK